jgi:hypothetical protein
VADSLFDAPPESVQLKRSFEIFFLSSLVFMFVMAFSAIRSNSDTGIAISDVVDSNGFRPKSVMYVIGLICGALYLFSCFFYLMNYTSKIWDNFFAQEGDKNWFYFMVFGQLISISIMVLRPHFWYVNIGLLNIALLLFIYVRYRQFAVKLHASGITEGLPDAPDKREDDHAKQALTKLYLLRSGVRSLFVVGLLYDGTFILMLSVCHFLRHVAYHWFSDEKMEMLFAGMYISISLVFAVKASGRYIIKAVWGLDILRERANKSDHLYFKYIIR